MLLQGVHHISLNVADTETAGRFYTEVLGLEQIPRPAFGFPGMWLQFADGRQLHLLEVADHEAPAGQHFAISVADIDAAVTELRARGAAVGDVSEVPGGVARQAFFTDPSGNLIELNQPLR